MWTLKIKLKEKGGPAPSLAEKFKVKVFYYAVNNYSKDGKAYFTSVGYVEGPKKNVEKFFRSLKAENRKKYLEISRNFFVFIYFEEETNDRAYRVKLVYNPKFLYLKPVMIDEKGWELWEIACPERHELDILLDEAQRWNAVKYHLYYIKKQHIENMMPLTWLPNLTQKQKLAVEAAIDNGYYETPRKIALRDLAKIMKTSKSNYQQHLTRAEQKIITNKI